MHVSNEDVWIFKQISLKIVPSGWIINKSALVQVMGCRLCSAWSVHCCIYVTPGPKEFNINLIFHIHFGAIITQSIFYWILTKYTPHLALTGAIWGVICDLTLIYILLQSTQCCMKYRIILDCVIATLDCISKGFSQPYDRPCLPWSCGHQSMLVRSLFISSGLGPASPVHVLRNDRICSVIFHTKFWNKHVEKTVSSWSKL